MTFDRDDIKRVVLATAVFLVVNFSCRWVLILLLKGHPMLFDIPSWLFASDVAYAEIIRLGRGARRDILFVPALITATSSFFAYLSAHRVTGNQRFEKVHMSIAVVWFAILTTGAFLFLSSPTHNRPDLLLKTVFVFEMVLFFSWIIKRQHNLKTKTR